VVKKTKPEDSLSFEQAMQQLEQLIETMEQGDLSLDDSLEAFEKGVKLTRICQQVLKEAEQKVQILSDNTPDAELEPFERDS
jgi:exodeoxyribonuclease VII small subunit